MNLSHLIHPYSRYGLAVALLQAKLDANSLNETNTSKFLIQTLEMGLSHFRIATGDNPTSTEVLRYETIKLQELKRDSKLIQSAGLAAQGKYLLPTVVTTDGDAKGTFDNAENLIESLQSGEFLDSDFVFSRSFAPTTAKINNGRSSQSPPKGTLFEAACAAITTLTPIKPAAWIDGRNTVIIPDLPLDELKDFVELFQNMMTSSLDGNLYEAKLPPKPKEESEQAKPKKKTMKEGAEDKPRSEYRRPRLHNGNYPFAPRQAAFGATGLLAAIGKWAREAKQIDWARRVLESITGNEEKNGHPLYIISYDNIEQAQFTHHVVGLSIDGKLSEMIDALVFDTRLYADFDNPRPNRTLPTYQLFYLMVNRFLQLFSPPAFSDFLMTRAEYSTKLEPLFKEYFMEAEKIDMDIVGSVRALGQWLNRTAYFVADSEVNKETADRLKKVRQAKAKILVEFESAAMSAKTPQEMLYRISTRAGRLLQQDAPAEATRFMDATASGEIKQKDALHLLIAYMRLRTTSAKEEEGNATKTDDNNSLDIP